MMTIDHKINATFDLVVIMHSVICHRNHISIKLAIIYACHKQEKVASF